MLLLVLIKQNFIKWNVGFSFQLICTPMWCFTNTCNKMFWMSLISTDWQYAVLREKRLRESGTAPSSPKSAFPPPFPWLSCICTNSTTSVQSLLLICNHFLCNLSSANGANNLDVWLNTFMQEKRGRYFKYIILSWAVWQVCPKQSLSLFSVRGLEHQNLISRLKF